jgi:hypothetical protein
MAWKFKSGFAGEVFDRRRSRSPRLAEYLLIYVQYLAPERRTDTNELIEFLGNPNPGQIIVYFGLSYLGKPCGFATLMLYPESGVGIIDHIAIAPTARGYGAFFSFCEFIADYLETRKIVYNYLVSEIVIGENAYVTGMPPLTLLRLIRFVGFRLANIPYTAPDPAIVTGAKACRAALMLVCQPDRTELDAAELLRVVHVVFFRHYLDWCRRTMPAEELFGYDAALRKLYDQISEAAQREGTIKINGMKSFDLPYLVDHHKRPSWKILGYMTMVAIPAILTIAVAFAQEARLAAVALVVTCLLFALLLIPRLRRPLLKFFQQE